MSLLSGLSAPNKLGGIFALSSYLLLQGKAQQIITEKGTDANKETKIFQGHGDRDEVVKYEFGKLTAEKLKEWGYNVDFKTYP
jgi:predicted esterase